MPEIKKVKHKRRFCRVEGCKKIVKSQGLCQRHGAKTKKCKIACCHKQAQGNFDGMCKSHFKSVKVQLIDKTEVRTDAPPPPPEGFSVFDKILPESIGFSARGDKTIMPLVQHLKEGFDQRPRAWHRNDERRARGLHPVTSPAVQLEGWERELVWMEICVLSGCPDASFRHLARAWGRDKGFHMVLTSFICERRGNVERKRRDKGRNAVTKKAKRAPVAMEPGAEGGPVYDIPGNVDPQYDQYDKYDWAMIGLDENDLDPTLWPAKQEDGSDSELPSPQQQQQPQQRPPQQQQQPPQQYCQPVTIHNSPSKGKRGKRMPMSFTPLDDTGEQIVNSSAIPPPSLHLLQAHAPQPTAAPPFTPGKVLTAEDLVLEDSIAVSM